MKGDFYMKKEERLKKIKDDFMKMLNDNFRFTLSEYMEISSLFLYKYDKGSNNERMAAAILINTTVYSNEVISMNSDDMILKTYSDYKNYYNYNGRITAVATKFVEKDTNTVWGIDCHCYYSEAIVIS